MDEEETVEAAPSEDNGNVPLETPSESAEPVVPAEKETTESADSADPAATAEPEGELFELPDGRKVDAETLSKEWKENFMPDYTKKSQALAAKEKLPISEPVKKVYEDPDWQPQTYAELIELAKTEVKGDLEAQEIARIEHTKAIEDSVVQQLNELKASDKTLNENALFLHANKYGFRDLKTAHQNMKDMSDVVKKVQKSTADNIAKRNDPVSISPGAGGARPDPSQFGNAVEYLRSLK